MWFGAAPQAHAAKGQSTKPLLNSSAFSYLGYFECPNTINGLDFTNSGVGLAVDHGTGGGAYPDGVIYNGKISSFNVVRLAIPTRSQIANWATNPVTATVVGSPVTFPSSAGTGSIQQSGMISYGGNLIYSQAVTYTAGGQTACVGVASLDMSSITAMLPMTVLNGMRHTNQYFGNIPSDWQSSFGGPCFIGASVESTYQDGTTGLSLYVFDPANAIAGVNPVPTAVALDYLYQSTAPVFAKSLGGQTAANGWTNGVATSADCTFNSTSLTINTLGSTAAIITGAVGTGFAIASGASSTQTAVGFPIGATLLSQQSGTPGGVGVYTMSAPATATVSGGFCAFGSADNGYFRPSDMNWTGPIFPSNSRTIAFIGTHGTGPLSYKNPNDVPSGWGSTPYERLCLMFDANDLLSVMSGAMNSWDVLPYTTFTIPPPTGSPMSQSYVPFVGGYYDDTPLNGNPSRFYIGDWNLSNYKQLFIHVFEVAH